MARHVNNPVLPEHEVLFWSYVYKWQHIFNLRDWRIIQGLERERSYSNKADLSDVQPKHRAARLTLGKDFGREAVTAEALESLAIHELLHLLFHLMLTAAVDYQDMYSDEVSAEEHSVIITLEPLLLKLAHLMEQDAKQVSEPAEQSSEKEPDRN